MAPVAHVAIINQIVFQRKSNSLVNANGRQLVEVASVIHHNHKRLIMDFQTTLTQITFLPLRLLFGGRPQPCPKENTKAFLDKCDGPIAHRGGTPENTLIAISQSEQKGAVGIEVDLAFTKDRHPVLLHDTTVDRTCDGSGDIETLTLDEVRKFDFGIKAGPEFKGEKIPTLQETIAVLKKSNLQLFLEVKDSHELAVRVVGDMFAKDRSLLSKIAVISFYPNYLLELRRRDPEIVTGLLGSATEQSHYLGGKRKYRWWVIHQMMVLVDKIAFWFLMKWVWRRLGVGFLMPNKEDILTGKFDLEQYRQQGVGVIPWTVNSQKDKDYFQTVLRLRYITDRVDGPAPDQTEG